MLFEGAFEHEILIVVPNLDFGVVGAGDDEGLAGMHNNSSDEIGVCFEIFDLFHSVVVEDSHVEIVRPADDPVFAAQELDGSDGEGGGFEGADAGLP